MSDIFSKIVSEADTSNISCCDLMNCAVTLATMGMDVIPSGDKWDHEFHWSDPECGSPIAYYIVETRYAVFDTSASLTIKDDQGAIGLRVFGVDTSMVKMGVPSRATYSDTIMFHGIDFNTLSFPEPDCPE